MTAPHFSVVIPCFRAGATIDTTLRSVLAQSEQDFEVILVDDGCPTASGIEAFARMMHDPRVKLLRQANAGPSAARNAGAAMARGAFIAFLDSDDCWSPDCLAQHRAAFERDPALGVSFARVRFCDAELRWAGRLSGATGPLSLVDALGDNPSCTTSNLVIRREAFEATGGFDPSLRYAEDQDFIVRVLARGTWRICGLTAPLVDYRTSPAGLSADLEKMRQGWLAMLARARTIAPTTVARAERPSKARFYRYLARRALRTDQPASLAFRYLCCALLSSPMALLRHQPRRSALTALGVTAALLLPDRLIRPIVAP